MHLAVTARRRRATAGAAVRWLVVTVAARRVFLANQALEYVELDFSISSHAYGSIFYLMTGFHGLHVIGGLGVHGRGRRGHRRPHVAGARSTRPVTVCAYYWHFVDVVWVAMFATIYLLQ